NAVINKSKLAAKYNQPVDSESAYEILTAKLQEAANRTQQIQQQQAQQKQADEMQKTQPKAQKETSIFDSSAMKQVERTAASVITRSLLGALGLGGRTKRLW
ncbi:MAG: helicase HerA-like domain-containing protein, partial [Parafilimonas sp.]